MDYAVFTGIVVLTATGCLGAWVLHLYRTYLEIRREGVAFRARARAKPRIDAESSPHLRTRRVPQVLPHDALEIPE